MPYAVHPLTRVLADLLDFIRGFRPVPTAQATVRRSLLGTSLTVCQRILHTAFTRPLYARVRLARFTVLTNQKLTESGGFTVVPLAMLVLQATAADYKISGFVFGRHNRLKNKKKVAPWRPYGDSCLRP